MIRPTFPSFIQRRRFIARIFFLYGPAIHGASRFLQRSPQAMEKKQKWRRISRPAPSACPVQGPINWSPMGAPKASGPSALSGKSCSQPYHSGIRSECNRPLKRARPVAVAAPISYLHRNHGRGDGSG